MDEIEQELLDMLAEPTADKVRRDHAGADVMMCHLGRAMTSELNALFADMAARMHRDSEIDSAIAEGIRDGTLYEP